MNLDLNYISRGIRPTTDDPNASLMYGIKQQIPTKLQPDAGSEENHSWSSSSAISTSSSRSAWNVSVEVSLPFDADPVSLPVSSYPLLTELHQRSHRDKSLLAVQAVLAVRMKPGLDHVCRAPLPLSAAVDPGSLKSLRW